MTLDIGSLMIAGYRFEGPYYYDSLLPDEPDVYVILTNDDKGNWSVLDVGQSEHLRTRVANHDRAWSWRLYARGLLAAAIHRAAGPLARTFIESGIRLQYNPPCGTH